MLRRFWRIMKKVFLSIALALPSIGNAAIIPVTTNSQSTQSKVSAVRVESRWAFVSFDSPALPSDCPNSRVYLNLESESHKVAYSTALAAFMSGKNVAIRADTAPSQVFGACQLYDIYVVK